MKLLGTVRWGCSCGNASCGAAFASCPPSSPWLLGLLLISLADSKLLASRSRRAAASCRRCRRASARTSEGSREPVTWRACMLMACASRKKAAALLLRCATSSRDSSRTLAFECGRTPSASPGPRLEARRAAAGRPSSSPPWSSEGSGERPAGGRLTSRRETSRTTATFGRAPPKFLLTSAVSGETGENGSSSHSGLRVAMSNFATTIEVGFSSEPLQGGRQQGQRLVLDEVPRRGLQTLSRSASRARPSSPLPGVL
eukprot:CAMPEP_0115471058 /NCGR_PEP_ID=MMETSP0271-20121206/52325_1 /TAXON_ID=71861 /ORGANISM="Scrippsiella trochoidea, Strain CCMP3099" /LENGTH=256 /DNA_ID=CAMNT_0002898227 /DNA_START=256 /DNA_END=1021 /DNA_ORIENTATION=+